MGHSHRHPRRQANVRVPILLALLSFFVVLVIITGTGSKTPHSSEARFTDLTENGMQIVPASGGSTPTIVTPTTVTPTQPPAVTSSGSSCGFTSVCYADGSCTTTGTYDPSPPGCDGKLPSGCGANTLNDKCPSVSLCWVGTLLVQCPPSALPDGCGPGTLNNQCGSYNPGTPTPTSCPTNFYYCSANDLYQRTYATAPACRSQDTFITHCDLGCDVSSGICISSFGTAASITARPSLVRSGNSTTVTVQATGVRSCAVQGTNGDAWSCSNVDCANMTHISSPLVMQTSFELVCDVPDQSSIVKSVTVNIAPVFRER